MSFRPFRFVRIPSWRELQSQVLDLGGQVNELTVQLFEAQQFERIASDKLKLWVGKHDDLLIKYKHLISTYEPDTSARHAPQDDQAAG